MMNLFDKLIRTYVINRVYILPIDYYSENDMLLHQFSGTCLADCANDIKKYTPKYVKYRWNETALETGYSEVVKKVSKISKDIVLPKRNKFCIDYYKVMRNMGCMPEGMLIPKNREFKISCELSPTLFYIYLTHLRAIFEEQSWVYNLMTLINEGVDFWLAYVIASATGFHNSSHGVLPINMGQIQTDVSFAVALKRYFSDPVAHDKRPNAWYSGGAFSMHQTMRNLKPADMFVNVRLLTNNAKDIKDIEKDIYKVPKIDFETARLEVLDYMKDKKCGVNFALRFIGIVEHERYFKDSIQIRIKDFTREEVLEMSKPFISDYAFFPENKRLISMKVKAVLPYYANDYPKQDIDWSSI